MTKVRFAPSPTGKLHVGNVRTALFNYLFARKAGGTFVLRIDDTDLERSTQEYEDGIRADLTWLGMTWDETFKQSERFDRYNAAAEDLKAKGLLYACYETGEELDRKRRLQMANGRPPVYDRAALNLTDAEKAALEAEGRKPHWRFKLSGNPVSWTDLVRGDVTIETSSLSDPILIREDGSYLYTLPSVCDDIDAEITHIIRGEDHTTNSGAQIEIFEALGGKAPSFGHQALLVGADGGKLSKRLGSLSMQDLREEEGFEAMAVNSLLGRIGTSDPVEPFMALEDLLGGFSLDRLTRSPARFDPEELARLNAKILHETGYAVVQERLADMGADAGEAVWAAVRPNLERLRDAKDWAALVNGPVTPVIEGEDADFIASAADALPAGELTEASWGEWTGALKEATGRKGKGLFMPLRHALTGQPRGPEMAVLLPLIGRDKVLARLKGEAA
ncbi:MAG: glutamate--tRNA ligase [Maricaulis sp.]|uniref:glutamate--tRNA ligase n=1 Tax=Maricaulis sp. TaxID=1486257 RepID=UPI001B17360F|nr:glutamate--tRNA ligase [Maricaulis sp.]MBO6848528.1 glutamate--tRNA ligase [Maricaulis sp.]MBO6878463.1 glutamate--tRNA ligase [Maricaulis sp.]